MPGISVNGATFGHTSSRGGPAYRSRRDDAPAFEHHETISNVANSLRIPRREQERRAVLARSADGRAECEGARHVALHAIGVVDEREIPEIGIISGTHVDRIREVHGTHRWSLRRNGALHRSLVRREEARGAEKERGFSRVRAANYGYHLSTMDSEVHRVERSRRGTAPAQSCVVGLGETANMEEV
jgi:hypothetical protein